MSELFTNVTTAETIERLWAQMSRVERVRALKAIAALPQRPGSAESLLATARRQAFENDEASFLPGLRYSPDHADKYEVLAEEGQHAESTFARFWLACHRHAEWGELIWYAVGMYLYPHWMFGGPADYKRASLDLLRAVREARA